MRISKNVRKRIAAATLGLALVSTACTTTDDDTDSADIELTAALDTDDASGASGASGTATTQSTDSDESANGVALFDSGVVHDIEIEFDDDDYAEMIATYETSGEKDWIQVTVTIDGTTLEDVGLRLKGNSSLFGLTSETADDPEELPWLIRFDKFVDGQTYQGYGDLVIRSNSTETAMNEAVAVELLEVAGLATEEAIATALTVNGGDTELRLAMEHPDEIWAEDEFGDDDGLLYKADSEGDYSYRGDDHEAYADDVFDVKAGDDDDPDDWEPLIEFLDFINNSDDATFGSELGDHLDVDAFADYLAFQELIGNFDDIDGPGNNSYLYFDTDDEQFTVVNWDLNLAFDTANGNGGGPGAGGAQRGGRGGRPPGAPAIGDVGIEDGAPVDGARGGVNEAGAPNGGGFGGGEAGERGGNVLSERFLADDAFTAMYSEALVELSASMYESGTAADIVATWTAVLTEQASDLVDASTIQAEADAILASIQGA
ncbi:MAG: CotH kinase family protein [Ilumatobacter sp.]